MSTFIILLLVGSTLPLLLLIKPKVKPDTRVFVYPKWLQILGFAPVIAVLAGPFLFKSGHTSFSGLIALEVTAGLGVIFSVVMIWTASYSLKDNKLIRRTIMSEKVVDLSRNYSYVHIISPGNKSAEMWRISQGKTRITIDKFIAGYELLLDKIPTEGEHVDYVVRN